MAPRVLLSRSSSLTGRCKTPKSEMPLLFVLLTGNPWLLRKILSGLWSPQRVLRLPASSLGSRKERPLKTQRRLSFKLKKKTRDCGGLLTTQRRLWLKLKKKTRDCGGLLTTQRRLWMKLEKKTRDYSGLLTTQRRP